MGQEVFYSAIVNQKLAFARVAVNAAAAEDEGSINAKLARHAHLDAAVAHLCGALSYFIVEVGEQYGLKLDPALKEPPALLDEFAQAGKESAEVAELFSLRRQSGSWFRELLQARANPLFLPERFRAPEEEASASGALIPVLNVGREQDAEQGPVGLLREWARSAQALVDRLRANLHEE